MALGICHGDIFSIVPFERKSFCLSRDFDGALVFLREQKRLAANGLESLTTAARYQFAVINEEGDRCAADLFGILFLSLRKQRDFCELLKALNTFGPEWGKLSVDMRANVLRHFNVETSSGPPESL